MCNGLFWGFSCVMFFVIEMEKTRERPTLFLTLLPAPPNLYDWHATSYECKAIKFCVVCCCRLCHCYHGHWIIFKWSWLGHRSSWDMYWSYPIYTLKLDCCVEAGDTEYTIRCTDDYGDGWSGHVLTILIGDLIVCDSSQQSWKTEYAFATTFGACLWTMDVTWGAEDDATGAITC